MYHEPLVNFPQKKENKNEIDTETITGIPWTHEKLISLLPNVG